MNQFKRVKYTLLRTRDDSVLSKAYLANPSYLRYNKNGFKYDSYSSNDNQHLYITSDEEIKEGDWFINELGQLWQHNGKVEPYKGSKKIIATTDTLLEIKDELWSACQNKYEGNKLPQPSLQFIERFIEAFNKNEIISEVLVEYNEPTCKCNTSEQLNKCPYNYGEDCTKRFDNNDFYGLKPKVDKNNCITIKKLKDSWNREEVIKLLNKLNHTLDIGSDRTLEEWVEQNL